ncbi:MAG TPA: hypothetical protein VK167_08805 [Flavipsychrobacter sp.]|nr:hypothetical protein [Flavipsychrobacter sp.]
MKSQHEIFVREMIRHGNKTKAYLAAYPDATGEALRTAATRLLNKPHIQQAINNVLLPLREKAAAELEATATQRIKEEICTLQQRREALAKIILGKMQVKKHIRLKDTIQEVYDDVSPYAIIRAIDLDSKLAANKYKEKIQPTEQPAPTIQPTIQKPPADVVTTKPVQTDPQTPDSQQVYYRGEPGYEEAYQRDVDAFFKMSPHLPADYLTNPKYNNGVLTDQLPEMLQTPPPENSVTVCNQTEPETEQDAETTRRWQTYLRLDPQLAHLPPEALRIREANFRRMKPAAQQSLIRPLQQYLQDVKNYPQRLPRAS